MKINFSLSCNIPCVYLMSEIFFSSKQFNYGDQNSISFKFRTLQPEATLLHIIGNILNRDFLLLEIIDGQLHLVYNFGGETLRKVLSKDPVADGEFHKVKEILIN